MKKEKSPEKAAAELKRIIQSINSSLCCFDQNSDEFKSLLSDLKKAKAELKAL